MTTKQLMKPRYKVISDYPDSILNVGDIVDTGENSVAYVTEISKCDLRDFPHLFKKLEWWEERRIEDMPEYVKCRLFDDSDWNFIRIGTYYFHHYLSDGTYSGIQSKVGGALLKSYITPATKEEYEENFKPVKQ